MLMDKDDTCVCKRPAPDETLALCTTCWTNLRRPQTDALDNWWKKRPYSTTSGKLLSTRQSEGDEADAVDTEQPGHPISLLARPAETRWPELVAEAEWWAQQRPWELRIGGGHCFLVRARLLEGVERELARREGVRPVVWEYPSPVVSMHRKASLQRYLPPGLSLAAIPERRTKPGRKWRQGATPSEWEQDRQHYYHLRVLAYKLRGKPEGQEAAEALLLARQDLSHKYKGARKCRMCPNFIPRTSRALYCKPACKERGKTRNK